MFGRFRLWMVAFVSVAISMPHVARADDQNATAGGSYWPFEISLRRTITVDSDPARLRVWYELRLAEWAPALLDHWQATLDPSFLGPKDFGTVQLATEPCCSDAQCEGVFGFGASCDNGGSGEGICTPSFQDANKPGWPFGPAVPIAAPYLTFTGNAPDGAPLVDDGSIAGTYAGTMVIDILNPAVETFPLVPVNLIPAETFMTDAVGQDIPISQYLAGYVGAETGQCCSLKWCMDDATEAACYAAGGWIWNAGSTCADGCMECVSPGPDPGCSDGNVCTSDSCSNILTCVREPWYDTRTECCVPTTGQLFGGPDAKLDPCKRIICNVQNRTYSFEWLPTGTPCDDDDICTQHTFCNAAGACVGQPAYGLTCPKSRYLSFRLDQLAASGCNDMRAVRVTLLELPGFEGFNGEKRWLSAPSAYPEIYPGETFNGATLQCDPHFDNFGAAELMHVFGAGVIPGATYEVQTVDTTCTDLNDPACYSAALTVQTGVWGDIVEPFWTPNGPAQPDFKDISGAVESFKAVPGAPIKARAQLQPNVPDPNAAVDFKDIANAVAAFVTNEYPYDGPNPCQ